MLFWAFAQQCGGRLPSRAAVHISISTTLAEPRYSGLFRSAMFQSVNAFAVLCGVVWHGAKGVSGNRTVRSGAKFALGLGLVTPDFCSTLSARWSAAYGRSSMPLMVLGLAVMGFAELFIDPVAMSQITY